jgi:hypothetical protein
MILVPAFYFATKPTQPVTPTAQWGRLRDQSGQLRAELRENALLRCGLTLAGANTVLRGGAPPEEIISPLIICDIRTTNVRNLRRSRRFSAAVAVPLGLLIRAIGVIRGCSSSFFGCGHRPRWVIRG